jgi:outer membrane biosynthesis protein TonB
MMETTVTDDGLNKSLGISAGLHLCLLLLFYFGLPSLLRPLPVHHDIVPFEIVDVSELTNTRVEEPKEKPQPPAPPPKPVARTEEAKPSPPQPMAESIAKPIPSPKPKPKPIEVKKPPQDNLLSVLKNVEKMKETEQPKVPDAKNTQQKPQEARSLAPALSTRLTISEEDALRRQISQCWNMPVGARDAQNLVVEVIIAVNPDRTVARADIVDKSRMDSDPFFRAAAEASLRALFNPRCSPLELPPDKFEQWKTIDFTFDPRDML